MKSTSHLTLSEKDYAFMSSFSLPVIQQVLLSDPDPVDGTFPDLTLNGLPKEGQQQQVFFHSFVKDRGFPIIEQVIEQDMINSSSNDSDSTGNGNGNGNGEGSIPQSTSNQSQSGNQINEITKTIQRAFNDSIISQIQSTGSYQPLQNLLLEVHSTLRSLIPNRQDLHHILLRDDDIVQIVDVKEEEGEVEEEEDQIRHQIFKLDSLINLCTHLKKIGVALVMLESEYRSETTKQWMNDILLNHLQKLRQLEFESSSNFGEKDDDGDGNDDGTGIHTSVSSLSSRSFNTFRNEDNDQTVLIVTPSIGEEGEEETIQETVIRNKMSMTAASFVLASTTFLHYKAELAKKETADFQFSTILAPKIFYLGKQFLFQKFQENFGTTREIDGLSESDNRKYLPNTKVWVEELIQNTSNTTGELLSSEKLRVQVLLQGWVDTVLFRALPSQPSSSSSSPPPSSSIPTTQSSQFLTPEVLWLDTSSIRGIRQITKMAVVGSVLGLHATSTAGVNDSALKKDPLDPIIENCRVKLAEAMGNRNVGSQELYERNIGDAVCNLAKGESSGSRLIIS